MILDSYYSVVALVLQLIAFAVWTTLSRKLERWIWLTVWAGFIILIGHRVVEAFKITSLGEFTATLFSLFALAATLQTRLLALRHAEYEKHLDQLHKNLIGTPSHAQDTGLAAKLSEIIIDLKDELAYYRERGQAAGVPPYKKDRAP